MPVCAHTSGHQLLEMKVAARLAGGRKELCNVLNVVFHAQPGLTRVLLAEPMRLPLLVGIAAGVGLRFANGKNAIRPDNSLA